MKIRTAHEINIACYATVLGFRLAKKKIPAPVVIAMCILEGAVLINGVIAIHNEVKKLM